MADTKKKKLGDFIMVEIAKGVPATPVYRNDMTEEQWAKVKETARKKGTLVGGSIRSGIEGGDAPVDLEVNKKVEPATPPSSAGIGVFPDRSKEGGEEPKKPEAPPQQEEDSGFSLKKEVRELKRVVQDITKPPPDPDADPPGTWPENPLLPPQARPGYTPGTGEWKTDPTDDTNVVPVKRWFPTGTQQVSPGVYKLPNPINPNDPVGEPNQSFIEKVDEFGNKIGQGIKSVVAPIGEAVNRVLTPTPKLNEQQLAARDDADEVLGNSTPAVPGVPAEAPPPPAGTVPPVGSGSVSAGVKVRTPGSATLPPAEDPFADEKRQMQGAAETLKAAEREKVKVEQAKLDAEAKILDDKIKFTADNEKKRLAAVQAYDETLSKGQEAMNAISEERRALMNTPVDPDAYYTKGGVGRAVAAAISGALFGWTGQGMQFLQRMDALAQQEVKNQQDELARRSNELGLIASDKKNVIALAREKGMNAIESLAAAKVSFFEGVKDQMAKVAAENPNLQAEAAKQIALIDQKLAAETMALKQATQMQAHQNVQDKVALMNANTNRMEAYARVAAAGNKDGGQKLKPQQQARISDILNSSKQMSDMMKNYREKTGAFSAVTQFAPAGSTDAAQWKDARRGYAKSIGRGIEGGKLTDKDEDSILDSYIPSPQDFEGNVKFKGQRLAKYAADKYRSELEGLEGGDYRTYGLPSPEEFEAHLLKQMGLTPDAVPGEKPYGK